MSLQTKGCDSRRRVWPIVVCGRQPNRDGTMHTEHKDLVEKALATYLSLRNDSNFEEGKVVLVLLGGVTAGNKSEALLAYEYLVVCGQERGVVLPAVLLEDRSRSSHENIQFAKACFVKTGRVASRLYVVARASQCPKVYDMVQETWLDNILQKSKVTMIAGVDTSLPRWYRWLDATMVPRLRRIPLVRVVWDGGRFARFH